MARQRDGKSCACLAHMNDNWCATLQVLNRELDELAALGSGEADRLTGMHRQCQGLRTMAEMEIYQLAVERKIDRAIA
jgi:hypothetical protein